VRQPFAQLDLSPALTPTTSIAAHAGHQHSYSPVCGRNVTFLSSVQMKKMSPCMMMNRIMHADEL
jgi:hypothetical protein